MDAAASVLMREGHIHEQLFDHMSLLPPEAMLDYLVKLDSVAKSNPFVICLLAKYSPYILIGPLLQRLPGQTTRVTPGRLICGPRLPEHE